LPYTLAWVTVKATIVGCAGSFPGPQSPASCYLIEAGDFRLVLDLGNGSLGALQRLVSLDSVDAICLSHLHSDHCLDMCGYSVWQTSHPDGPRPPITVYGPAGTAERLTRAVTVQSPATSMTSAFDFRELTVGSIEIGPLRVRTALMNHPVQTFGFRIEHDGQVLAYSADTGPTPELVGLAAGADVLLSEASFLERPDLPGDLHLTAHQAGLHAAQAGVGELVLTHLVAWNDPLVSREEATTAFGGPLSLAAPGRELLG
jgi:ribonuclease BN (tRNA processing enzyme)